MYNKNIFIGKSGSGKSFKAIKEALSNEGTTIIVNGCVNKKWYEEKFPQLKNYKEINSNEPLAIKNGEKYYIFSPSAHNRTYNRTYQNKINSIIFDSKSVCLQDDPCALIMFDDGSWERYGESMISLLEKLTHVKCGIIIVVQSAGSLFYESDELKALKKLDEIAKDWNIIHFSTEEVF